MKKKTARPARKPATKRSRKKSSTKSARSHTPTPGLYSWITHTELASAEHVADARAAFEKALREGAEEILPPTPVMPGVTVAVVRAPGGIPVGLSGP